MIQLATRVVAADSGHSLVVEFKNPKNDRWEIAITCFSDEAASKAKQFYDSRTYNGWSSAKLSKSNQ
jgi:hypothetical protein